MKPMELECRKLETCRSTARMLWRFLLVLGFIIQTWTLLEMYLQYPSTLEMEVVQPSLFEMPAFTVCNINEIKSTDFCDRYSQYCDNSYSPSDPTFCDTFPEYCRLVNSTKQVPKEHVSKFLNLTRYEQQRFGHRYEDLITKCTIETHDDKYDCTGKPLLVPAMNVYDKVPFNCFMMYSLHEKPDEQPEEMPVSMTIFMELNMEVSEYHPSHVSRGALLSLHSPYHIPSPYREGLFLNMGSVYRIYVNMANRNLLKYPFKSNCINYKEQWKKNGGKGPVTEQMCKEMCKLNISLEKYGCAERNIDYPHNESICQEKFPHFARDINPRCALKCSSPCRIEQYELKVQEANSEGTRGSCLNATDLSCATLVYLIFDALEITTFTYRPKYEPVGFLCFIGGYVGLWLGISLLSVYDFLETRLFRLLTALKLRWKRRHGAMKIQDNTYDGRTDEERIPSMLLYRRSSRLT